MQEGFIFRQIRRGNRNLSLAGGFLCVAGLAFFALTARSTINDILGPVPMSPEAIVAVKNPSSLFRYYVSTRGVGVSQPLWNETYETYDRKTNKVISTEIRNQVQLLGLGDKLVLVRRRQASNALDTAGALVPVPGDLNELIATLNKSPAIASSLLPLLIDETRFGGSGWLTIIFGTPVLLLGLLLLFKGIGRASDVDKHPVVKKLSRLGDPRLLVGSIEEELRLESQVLKSGLVTLTENWLLTGRLSGLEILNLKELVWIYPKVTTQSIYFIPVAKDHALIACDSNGKEVQVTVPGKDADKLIQALHERAPWAFFGYVDEYQKMWKKENRSDMIAAVQERIKSEAN